MIFEKIVALLSEQLGVDAENITMDTSFEELGADSVDVVDLTMAVEEAFNLEDLADENLSDMTTVGDFVRFLQTEAGLILCLQAPPTAGLASACRTSSTRFSKTQAFFEEDAARCMHSLTLAHLRPEKCVFRRTCRRNTRLDSLPPPAGGGTLRGFCGKHRRYALDPQMPQAPPTAGLAF